MTIDKKEVDQVALLARIELTGDESQVLTQELNDVLSFAEKLNELDTQEVLPLIHVLDLNNVFRADEVVESMGPELVVANAPEVVDNQFRVPRIM